MSPTVLMLAADVGRGGRESWGGKGWGEGGGCPLLTEMPNFQELLLTRTGGAVWCTQQGTGGMYCIPLCCTLLNCIALHCTELHCIILYCTVFHCIELYCTVVNCISLYCTKLYSIPLYRTVFHCIALYFTVFLCTFLHCISAHHNIRKSSIRLFQQWSHAHSRHFSIAQWRFY